MARRPKNGPRQPVFKPNPTISKSSSSLSFKNQYANHDVVSRLSLGRDKVLNSTRGERRLNNKPQYTENTADINNEQGEEEEYDNNEDRYHHDNEEAPESGYRISKNSHESLTPSRARPFDDGEVVQEEIEEEGDEEVEEGGGGEGDEEAEGEEEMYGDDE